MGRYTYFLLLLFLLGNPICKSQTEGTFEARNFPIVISLQFNAFSLPFRNFKSHFNNLGIGLGTEVNYSKNGRWAQKVMATWYRNHATGNGILVQTQIAFRPSANTNVFSELALGGGYFYNFRPLTSYRQTVGR